jgi:hypothetical protein
MSEVSGADDVGAVLGFLYRILRLEMHQLRGDDRPHHCRQSPKEFGGTRRSNRCGRLRGDITERLGALFDRISSGAGVCYGLRSSTPKSLI